MTDEITPALTPTQWADVNGPMFCYGVVAEDGSGFAYSCPDGDHGISISTVSRGDRPNPGICIELPAADSHTIAALALYEQPYGFTREDVKAMEVVYRFALSFQGRIPPDVCDAIERHYALAAKMDALLP